MQATAFTFNSATFINRLAGGRSRLVLRGLLALLTVSGGAGLGRAQTLQTAQGAPVPRAVAIPSAPATSPAAVPPAAPADVPSSYALNPSDVVEVKVFQEDDMDWTVRVTKDGTVNLPLVGVIDVLGKTPDEVGEIVRTRLHDGYLVHPQVSVAVMEFSKHRFTILGEVTRPGQVDFPDNTDLTLLDAVGLAGGYTKDANPSRVYVKRKVGEKEIVLTVDANRMARREVTPFKVLPGDTITVSQTIF